MGQPQSDTPVEQILDKILGHLNFASGQHDPRFFENLNGVFCHCQHHSVQHSDESTSRRVGHEDTPGQRVPPSDNGGLVDEVAGLLRQRLADVKETNDTFRDASQVETILNLVFEDFLPAYLLHHRDLFFHQTRDFLLNAFFTARVFEVVTAKLVDGDSSHQIITESLATINNHIGHRPVATLSSQKIQPYENEWVSPVPIFIKGAGTCLGKYQQLAGQAIEILQSTPAPILRAAQFDPEHLEELAIDPRSFDFDHPINKRPNHHFGTWDGHVVDNRGYYTRFIIHQVSLDSLLHRVDRLAGAEHDRDELLFEAASALAGTMLMGSGISGGAPGAYDSNTTLGSLLPIIARYRDEFYRSLFNRIPAGHRVHLQQESEVKKQIFGGVRQHLNAQLSSRRAYQLVNCRLASIFARMGNPDAA